MSRSFPQRPARGAGTFRRSARQGPTGRRSARVAGATPTAPHGVAPPPASSAVMLLSRLGRLPLALTVVATALATLAGGPVAAQSMEDRARAAAQAARTKSGDSDAIQQNYLSPGLSGQPIATVDGSRSFTSNLACQKTASLMEVLVQPSASGDLAVVKVTRDTDFDGTLDSQMSLPVAVSGICANGVISCQPGTWNQCRYFRWDSDAARALKLTEVDMTVLAGCYCLNNSCGFNLAWTNMNSVLGDLGGGMIGVLTTADPRIGVAQALIDGPMIRYVGAQSAACSGNPALPQTAYRANPAAIAGDAYAASASNAVFQALASSPVGLGKTQQMRHCTIERQVTVVKSGIDDVISRSGGGYATVRSGHAVDFYLGSPSDNSLAGGSCSLFDFRMTLHVADPDRITDARLVEWFVDDWGQVRIDGTLVASGPSPWTTTGFPPGQCELEKTSYFYPNLDLKPWLTRGDHEIWLRVGVSVGGEGMAQVHVQVDDSCRTIEQIVDQCGVIDSDPKCRIDSELVDGVQTFINGVKTGLQPLSQTRLLGSDTCPVQLTRDFFLKDRTYRCEVDSDALPTPDTSRGAYIIDHSTETLLADRARQSDGSFAETTRPFVLPDRGSVPACESICKTRAPHVNTGAAPAGVVGNRQNDPASYDTFYHACDSNNVCPLGTGEQLVTGCGCLDDFPEAVAMMQTVRLAGADLVCTRAVP